jgi:thiamine-monophosphate kinase
MTEFELIQRFFTSRAKPRSDLLLGIGDDCALMSVPDGYSLAVTMDTLVEGVHFFPQTDAAALGHKALAVNLSDLAAMGAEPAWVTLALTLPQADEEWLEAFSLGFSRLAERHGLALAGGDTTRGPLSVTIQAHGFVPIGQALTRAGARPGDAVYVSGSLGDAGLALRLLKQDQVPIPQIRQRLDMPEPRIGTGIAIRDIATACIDISDGLLADLGHILHSSQVGAQIALNLLPLSEVVEQAVEESQDWTLPLSSGDDYELCFTAPPGKESELALIAGESGVQITRIGLITGRSGLSCLNKAGSQWHPDHAGFDHFPNNE